MPEWISEIPALLPYLIIPFISGIVGWATNVLALKMTFYPLEYIGMVRDALEPLILKSKIG